MTRTTRIILIAAGVAVLALAALALRSRGEEARTWDEAIAVDRGPVGEALLELGTLAPRDPVFAKAPFTARLQWVIEDGSWVEPGTDLYILSDDEEVRRIAELRTNLVQGRAELRLARLRRAHGEQLERPKLLAAERALELAELNRRLVEVKPVGGLELVRLADELRPLAQATAAARASAEAAQDAYQVALDAYLAALDTWQGNRDRILRLQARLDELESGGGDAAKPKEDAAGEAATVRADMDAERGRTASLTAALEGARGERDRLQPTRDTTAAALAAAEQAEAPLRFRCEVEKRALPLARLQIDERQAVIDLEETRRTLAQVGAAVAAGALAASEEERLRDQLARHENALEMVRVRLAVAARPPDAQVLAEADAQLIQARTAAEDARAAYTRALALLDQDLELKQAQVERTQRQIDERSAGFPTVLEAGIRFAERELALLAPDEADERAAIEAQLAAMRAQHAQASAAPPNVIKAPVAGLARVQRQDDRHRQAGDMCWEADPMIEIYPPENMDVLLRVNEVDIRRLAVGRTASVVIPALDGQRLAGEVVQLSGVGRDKFARPEYGGKAGFADVVDFEVRVRLAGTEGLALRQGMAARVEIPLAPRASLRLPLAAVQRTADGAWAVRRTDGRSQTVTGEPAGPLWFALGDGLAEGDRVLISRTRNR